MPISTIELAILAMDAYNRGDLPAIEGLNQPNIVILNLFQDPL